MADAASSIVNYFKEKGGMAFINVMVNISVRCDCGVGAPPPKVRDIGVLASLDPVAIDRASFDLIKKENTEGSQEWIENSNSLLGENTLNMAEKLGVGSQDYNLINVDGDDEEEDGEKDGDKDNENKNNDDTEQSKIYLYIFIPIIILLVIIIGVLGFFLFQKNTKIKMYNQSLGISMTAKSE